MNFDLLPSNALASERALSLATEFRSDILPEDIRKLWSAQDAPIQFLPYMAWGLHVDFWRDSLSDDAKRGLVSGAFEWHRLEGTFGAIRRICEAVFGDTKIQAWHEYGGEPYRFRVLTAGRLSGPESWAELREAIHFAQALRDRLDAVVIERRHEGQLYAGTAAVLSPRVTIRPELPRMSPSLLTTGTASAAQVKKTVGLSRPILGRTDEFAGMAVTVAAFARTGRLNPPRPPFELSPQRIKAGLAAFTLRRVFIYPSVPNAEMGVRAGMATVTARFIKLRQEVSGEGTSPELN